jgi:hypothetical protein
MEGDPYARFVDPDAWTSTRCVGTKLWKRLPRTGEVIGYRYSAWRVTGVRVMADVDLVDVELDRMSRGGPRPYDLELTHLAGPRLDGRDRIVVQGDGIAWPWLGERFQTCSCHGHPWPCQDYDRDVLALTLGAKARRELAGATPGVCAACREEVTGRQQRLVFPEPSLIVPGAPGPTFHARRSQCWWGAHEYETKLRLASYPEADRLASCPGAGFVHEVGLRFECTAGPACTGLHGPLPKDRSNCATRTYTDLVGAPGYKRPISDCGYRPSWGACLGAEVGPCRPSKVSGSGLLPDSYPNNG